jgi:hypothetical protein
LTSGQDFEAFLKSVGLERFSSFSVVKGIVGVEPVALPVHFEIGNLGQFGRLNE